MQKRFERRHSRWYEKLLLGFPAQILIGLPFVLLPMAFWRWGWGFWQDLDEARFNTLLAIALCFVVIAVTQRRLLRFPGAHVAAYLVPTVTIVFLLAMAVLFFTREGYSRPVLFPPICCACCGFTVDISWVGVIAGSNWRWCRWAVRWIWSDRKIPSCDG